MRRACLPAPGYDGPMTIQLLLVDDDAVLAAVKYQEDAGVDIVVDSGERLHAWIRLRHVPNLKKAAGHAVHSAAISSQSMSGSAGSG
jgi:hypothetical protein